VSSHVTTAAPGRTIVLYDGHCQFCTVNLQKLLKMAAPGAIEPLSFQDPDVLERFPGLPYDACMQAMQLITPDGRIYRGFEAAVRAVATRPLIGWLAYVYYSPGVRQLCDWIYAWIAAHRYRLMGKSLAAGGCEGGTCLLHADTQKPA
jgi:predicted DCC family thiol-disulfide oxidoreductase YuxK